jgi:tRNA A-37 threonylcarbamoyl transferase component Bud32
MLSDPLLGRVIDDKYRIEAEIGAGGMATIYRATRLKIGDVVAIKILHGELLREPKFAERFQREAQAAARLKHPNVVTVHDFGVSDDGVIYLVMELVEGRNLRAMIKDDGPMPTAMAAEIIRQVCAALTEAHRQNTIHRDIKPANIAVTPCDDGPRVKVLDFGIASLRGGTMMTFTQTGTVMGTPAYMSPEQCLGEDLDGRSDIYSAGVVLFEMLCGVVPFNSPTATAVVMQHVQQAPPPLRVLNVSISPAVEAVVLRALAKRREDRQQSAKQLADELSAAVAGTSAPLYTGAHGFAAESFSPSHAAMTMVQPQLKLPAPPAAPARRRHVSGIVIGFAAAVVLVAAALGAQRMLAQRDAPSRTVAAAAAVTNAPEPVRTVPARPAVVAAAPVAPQTVATPVSGVLGTLYQTRELDVLGSSSCGTQNAVLIRFKDDGTSGCAWHASAVHGALESQDAVLLVPVTAPGRGRTFDLLYTENGAQPRFIGILPGDGSGNLSVSIENGVIVERNGDREKRSTLRSGRVVVLSTTNAGARADAAAAVRTFYSLWDAHRLPEAYGMLSSRYRAEHPYGAWESSHESVVHISVRTGSTNDPMTVAVLVRSFDRTPSGTTDSEYRGSWTAVLEDGTTRLDRVTLTQTR